MEAFSTAQEPDPTQDRLSELYSQSDAIESSIKQLINSNKKVFDEFMALERSINELSAKKTLLTKAQEKNQDTLFKKADLIKTKTPAVVTYLDLKRDLYDIQRAIYITTTQSTQLNK